MFKACFGGATKSNESINKDIEGDPLYINTRLGKIQEGVSFMFFGILACNANRILIDFGLNNPNKDIALRIAGAISRNTVGRNARINGVWGVEETSTAIPFEFDVGGPFQIEVLFTLESIMVAVDGFHVAIFQHRLPFHDIKSIEIKGDIADIKVKRKIVTQYPERTKKSKNHVCIRERRKTDIDDYTTEMEDDDNITAVMRASITSNKRPMPLPYYASFPKGFFDVGYTMSVMGRVKSKPVSFTISLQVGSNIWPQPTVALLLKFTFVQRSDGETGEPRVIRNSFSNGRWTGEISSELATGLRPGADFTLLIMSGCKNFEIFMNEKPITEYPYMVNPKNIDTMLVAGDLYLFNIEIEENGD